MSTLSTSLPFWIHEEISKARKLITSQASAAIPTHFSARRHQGRSSGVFSGFGGSSEPSPRLQFSAQAGEVRLADPIEQARP